MVTYQQNGDERFKQGGVNPDKDPIEPGGPKMVRATFFRWLFFGLVIIYILLTYFHAPLLTSLGKYLVVSHPPQKSDLIVCQAGANVEMGLAAAEAYQKELAPRVFVGRERLPDGYERLRKRGVNYPETKDLLVMLLDGLGVPREAILISEKPVENMIDEAGQVREIVKKKGFKSFILMTSPIHSRRAWLTFKKVFGEDKDVRILVNPTPYSNYNPEDWWKTGSYANEVVAEYVKLISYMLTSLW
ncbi:YdcF family protein [bacterium]|nr:YdcF family protein [bacterium]